MVRFSQPEYLFGYIKSTYELNSFLKIFITSFFGFLFFKLSFTFIEVSELNEATSKLGLEINNPKVDELLNIYFETNLIMFLFLTIILFIFLNLFIDKLKNLNLTE